MLWLSHSLLIFINTPPLSVDRQRGRPQLIVYKNIGWLPYCSKAQRKHNTLGFSSGCECSQHLFFPPFKVLSLIDCRTANSQVGTAPCSWLNSKIMSKDCHWISSHRVQGTDVPTSPAGEQSWAPQMSGTTQKDPSLQTEIMSKFLSVSGWE